MPKVPNPFFSFRAHGSLNKLLTARQRKHDAVIEKRPYPKDAKTSNQLAWRTMYQLCTDLWHTLTPAEKYTWEANARPRHLTGYAWYMSQCLRPNPGIYLPLAGGTMSGVINMDANKITDLPAPTNPQDAATKAYADAAGGAADYPMNLKPALTRYVLPGWYIAYTVGITAVAGRIYYIPIFVAETTTYTRICINVSTLSAGSADLRIFNWNNGIPGSLILSAGTVNTGTTGPKEITISQQLARGYYFLAVRHTGAPLVHGPAVSYAVHPPVPGITTTSTSRAAQTIPHVDAAYADPAPAPTALSTPGQATVYLREN